MVDTISELSDLSKNLNQKSDELNSIITKLNTKLAKLNIGLEAWIQNTPVHADEYHDTHDDEGKRIDRFRYVTLLGYARVADQWQLAIKEAMFQTEQDSSGREYEETVNPSAPQALLKASREIRSKSMKLIPKLLDVLKKRAESLLKNIEEAEALAEKL